MKLLLARHGNTFEPGLEPYIVGRNEDLPLTAGGEAQARALGNYLQAKALIPDTIVCGPLQRTRRTAGIVAELCGAPAPLIEDCLTELDYGSWSGLTTPEITARFGAAEMQAWDADSIMPANRGWYPDANALQQTLAAWLASLVNENHATSLAVTSNGILRFIPGVMALRDAIPANRLKVKTGHLCGFTWANSCWTLDFWNLDPAA